MEASARAVLLAAEQHAAEREREAEKASRWVEADAERRAERILQAALERAWVVLTGLEAVESGLMGTVQGLQSEAARLTADLTAQTANSPLQPPDPRPELKAGTTAAGDEPAQALPAAIDATESGLGESSPRQMSQAVRATVYKMRQEGRPRHEAELFLQRFHLDHEHSGLVDEMYGPLDTRQSPSGRARRRRLFHRAAGR
jgi:hypothetical protein